MQVRQLIHTSQKLHLLGACQACRMSDATRSTPQSARARQAGTGPSDVDPIKPQEESERYLCPKAQLDSIFFMPLYTFLGLHKDDEPEGILCPNAKQPSLQTLQLGVLEDRFRKLEKLHLAANSEMHVLVYSRSFDPILQKGPSCGMVALAMLARMLGKEEVTTEVIVDHARKRGYTKRGELFSVRYASAIAEDLLKTTAAVEGVSDCPWMVCEHLIDHAILFCYDDDDNQPCYHRGRSAHWALITGFALVYDEDLTPKQQEVFNNYKTRGNDDVSERLALRRALYALKKHSQASPTVYVLGRQGHCENTFYFQWSSMVRSSLQMVEYSNLATKCVLPPEGMAEALRGKFVKVRVPYEVAAFQVGSHAVEFKNLDVLARC